MTTLSRRVQRAYPQIYLACHVRHTIDHLVELGLTTRSRGGDDRRRVELRITATGIDRMQQSSVLDTRRVDAVLARLPAARPAAAVRGLDLIAEAARDLMRAERKSR